LRLSESVILAIVGAPLGRPAESPTKQIPRYLIHPLWAERQDRTGDFSNMVNPNFLT
jgi:hypothetical protein